MGCIIERPNGRGVFRFHQAINMDKTQLGNICICSSYLLPPILSAFAIDSENMKLSWTDLNECAEYEIHQSTGGPFTLIDTVSEKETIVTGLTLGVTYFWKVRAIISGFVTSDFSNVEEGTTALQAPSDLIVTGTTANEIFIAWTNNDVNNIDFRIEFRSENNVTFLEVATVLSGTTIYTALPIVSGISYYRVRAVSLPDFSDYTNTVSAVVSQGNSTFDSQWKTDNAGASGSTQVKLPLESVGTYNFIVSWGDGNQDAITVWDQAETTHTYASAGTFNVAIMSTITGFNFSSGSQDLSKILNISKWTGLNLGNSGGYFANCVNLTITAGTDLLMTGTTDFTQAFVGCVALTFFPLIDTSSVTNMSGAWEACFNLPSFPLLDTSSVTDMTSTWRNCTGFIVFPLIDTSAVTNLSGTWIFCTNLLSFPLINTSLVTDVSQAWFACISLTPFPTIDLGAMTDGTNAFGLVNMGTTAYSNLLVDIESKNSNNSVTFNGGLATYNVSGAIARAALIADHSWNITDGGFTIEAPSGLILSDIQLESIKLDWTSNSGGEEEGFDVQRNLTGSDPWVTIKTVGVGITTYLDDTPPLDHGVQYFYRIIAVSSFGNSDPSNIENAITAIMAAPSGLVASLPPLPSRIQLDWVSNSASEEDGFSIERSITSGFGFIEIGTVGTNILTFNDDTVLLTIEYFYRVRATEEQGNSPFSNEDSNTITSVAIQSGDKQSGEFQAGDAL